MSDRVLAQTTVSVGQCTLAIVSVEYWLTPVCPSRGQLNPFDKLGRHPPSGVEAVLLVDSRPSLPAQENPFERLGRHPRSGVEAVLLDGAYPRPSLEVPGQENPFEKLG
jgi:hypothetical protein